MRFVAVADDATVGCCCRRPLLLLLLTSPVAIVVIDAAAIDAAADVAVVAVVVDVAPSVHVSAGNAPAAIAVGSHRPCVVVGTLAFGSL